MSEEQQSKASFSLKHSLFYIFNQVTQLNPISHLIYLAMEVLEGMILLASPLMIIAEYDMPQRVTSRADQTLNTIMDSMFFAASAMQLLIGVLLVFFFSYYNISFKKLLKWNKELVSDETNPESNLKIKFLLQLIMILLVLFCKVILFPAIQVYLIMFRQFFQENSSDNIQLYQSIIAIIFSITALSLVVTFEYFFTPPFPDPQVPWAKDPYSYPNVYGLHPALYALTFSFQVDSIYFRIFIVVSFFYQALMLIGLIINLCSFSCKLIRVQIFKISCLVVASFIVMINTFLQEEDINSQCQLLAFLITSLSMFIGCVLFQEQYSMRQVTKMGLKTHREVVDTIGRVMMLTQVDVDSSKLIAPKIIILQSLFLNHMEKCDQEKCPCSVEEYCRSFVNKQNSLEHQSTLEISAIHMDYRNKMDLRQIEENKELNQYKQMQMALIRIIIAVHYNKHNAEQNHSQLIDLYIVKYQLHLLGNLFQNYFQLLQVHNCKMEKYSLIHCYWAFCLKVQTLKKIRIAEKSLRSRLNLERHILYQQLFHKYLTCVKDSTQEQLGYWKYLSQESFDIKIVVQKAEQIHKKYLKFKKCYSALTENLGQTLVCESLAFKLHKSVLNFEGESEDNLNSMCSLDIKEKTRFNMITGAMDYQRIDGKFSLVVISLCPDSFQKILCVNKQFCLLSGYSEEELRGKLNIVMPVKINEIHDNILKEYIEKQNKRTSGHSVDIKTWIKHKNNTISPIHVKAHPQVGLDSGLNLVGLLYTPEKFAMLEQTLPTKSVFFILTDKYDQIMHISQNCHNVLNISFSAIHNQVQISEFFPELYMLESWQLQNQGFETNMNLDSSHIVHSESAGRKKLKEFAFRKKAKVRIQKIIHNIGHYMFDEQLLEYRFVIINDFWASSSVTVEMTFNQRSFEMGNTLQITDQVVDSVGGGVGRESRNSILMPDRKQILLIEASSDEDIDENTGSVTSASSSTRSNSSLRDIKGVLNLRILPQNLSRFKWNLVAFFAILILTSIALLIINLISKDDFSTNLEVSEQLLRLRNQMDQSKLNSIYLYTLANNDHKNFTQVYKQNDTFNSSYNNFKDWMEINILGFQSTLNNITSMLYQQNADLIEIIDNKYIFVESLTSQGTITSQNTSITTALEQVIVNLDSMYQSSYDELQIERDILYGINIYELKNYGYVDDPTKNFYFVIENSISKINDELKQIEDEFMQLLFAQNDRMIKGIMIMTVACSVIIIIASTIIFPFVRSLDQNTMSMLEMTMNIQKSAKQVMLNRINDFMYFINHDMYLMSKLDIYNEKFYHDEELEIQKPGLINENILKLQNQLEGNFEESKGADDSNKNASPKEKLSDKFKIQKAKHQKRKSKKNNNEAENPSKIFENEENEEEDNNKGQDESKHVITLRNSSQLKSMSFSLKVKKISAVYSFAFLICCFYTGSFFLSKSLFDEFIQSFEHSAAFYERKPCISNALFMIQLEYFQYEILYDNKTGMEIVERSLAECNVEESAYREILQAKKKVFKDIQSDLERVNSDELCDFMIENQLHDQNCSSELDGFYNLGLEQIIQLYIKNINQRKIELDTLIDSGRSFSQAQLQQMFFDEQTFQDVLTFFERIRLVLNQLQQMSEATVLHEVQTMFNYLLLIFSAFIMLMFVLVIIALKVVIKKLHNQMMQTQICLKSIPGLEYVRLKQEMASHEGDQSGIKDFLKNLGKL